MKRAVRSRPMHGRREGRGGALGRRAGRSQEEERSGPGERKGGASGQSEREEFFLLFIFPNPFSFLNSKQIQI